MATQYIDTRHSNFTEVHGSVYNYTTLPQTDLTELHRFCVNHASWNPQHRCLEGTRTSFIDDIDHWVNSSDQNTPRLFLVTGVAGSGKSSLAHTIAQRLDERGCLGSSFFLIVLLLEETILHKCLPQLLEISQLSIR